jgi:hypothetical protein
MVWKEKSKSWMEEIEVAVEGLTERVKELIQEGNVRRLTIRKMNDDLLLDIPLTAGVAVGAVLTYMLPLLVALLAITGLLTKVKIQVLRDEDDNY